MTEVPKFQTWRLVLQECDHHDRALNLCRYCPSPINCIARQVILFDAAPIKADEFVSVAESQLSHTGYGLTNAHKENGKVIVVVERYAMDGGGHHVGTEVYTATMSIIQEHWIVPDVFRLSWEPAQPPVEITEIDAEARLRDNEIAFAVEDDLVELANEHGLYEGDYCPPDDDFAWQELDHALGEIIKTVKEQAK